MKLKLNKFLLPLAVLVPLAALVLSFRTELGEMFLGRFLSMPPMTLVELPEMKVIYEDHKGSYQQSAKWLSDFFQKVRLNHTPCRDLWAQYRDNMLAVKEEDLRSRTGCVVSPIPAHLPEGMQLKTIAAGSYVRMETKSTNRMVLERAASALSLFAQKNGVMPAGPVMTLFDVSKQDVGQSTILVPVMKSLD